MKLDLGEPTLLWVWGTHSPTGFHFSALRYRLGCTFRESLKRNLSLRLYAELNVHLSLRSPRLLRDVL